MNPVEGDGKKLDANHEADDSLKLRPNPDMLMQKIAPDVSFSI